MGHFSCAKLADKRMKWSTVNWIQRRFKSKQKKAKTSPAKTPAQHALDHIDIFFRPVYGKLWPSLRASLLTTNKYCAVLNNYANTSDFEMKLLEEGAYDIIKAAQTSISTNGYETGANVPQLAPGRSEDGFFENIDKQQINRFAEGEELVNDNTFPSDSNRSDIEERGNEEYFDKDYDERKDLDYMNLQKFVPAKRVLTERDQLKLAATSQSVLQVLEASVQIVKGKKLMLPDRLKVYAYPRGDISTYPPPKATSRDDHPAYYLMDAASVLPVLALDLHPGDTVLDLCAAPGGKSLLVLQSMLIENLICNDISQSRFRRLNNVLRFYIPSLDNVICHVGDGLCFQPEQEVDKVLVDVPCNTDRHVLRKEDGGDLFRPSRIKERINLPTLQKNLLISGIKACKPGGSIVYSTCTLAPVQNDGVIDAACKEISQTSDIQLQVEDLSALTYHFRDTFQFHKSCRFGQLVLPNLSSNFGPMYFCKINKLE